MSSARLLKREGAEKRRARRSRAAACRRSASMVRAPSRNSNRRGTTSTATPASRQTRSACSSSLVVGAREGDHHAVDLLERDQVLERREAAEVGEVVPCRWRPPAGRRCSPRARARARGGRGCARRAAARRARSRRSACAGAAPGRGGRTSRGARRGATPPIAAHAIAPKNAPDRGAADADSGQQRRTPATTPRGRSARAAAPR